MQFLFHFCCWFFCLYQRLTSCARITYAYYFTLANKYRISGPNRMDQNNAAMKTDETDLHENMV